MDRKPDIKHGQIYYANLNPVMGSEQGGIRPVVIIQNDAGNYHSHTVIVAPMTTKKKTDLPTHIAVSEEDCCLSKDTTILLEQLRTIDKSRLKGFIGRLSGETMSKVDESLHVSLALNKEEKGDDLVDDLNIFSDEEFGDIRTVLKENEPWFVAKDIATALGYKNARDAVEAHVDPEDKGVAKCDTLGGKQNLAIINESGMYALIFGSKLSSAKKFKHWVTAEVLSKLRKTGSYNIERKMTPEEIMRVQLGMIDSHEERIVNLENNMTIDYGQQRVLEDAVNRTVIEVLGGKRSNAYAEIGRKVFAECNRDLKHCFDVNARNNVPKKRFDEAVEYAKNWKPCTNTQMMIDDCNAQLNVS